MRSARDPDIFTMISAFPQAAAVNPFECCSSNGTPRSCSTSSTSGATDPSGIVPALELSITSKAVCFASASANWLRQALPMHTKSTRVLPPFPVLPALFAIPRHFQKVFVHRGIRRKLGVKRRNQDILLPHQHRIAICFCEHLTALARFLDDRRANEHHLERMPIQLGRTAAHFARKLPAIRVARHGKLCPPERFLRRIPNVLRQQDRARTGGEQRPLLFRALLDRPIEPLFAQELQLRRAFAA